MRPCTSPRPLEWWRQSSAQVGTPAMKDRILGGAMKGDITIALGFTEPECGSDVAAATTKAVRDGDQWVINGSKMFTTNGHIADYVFLLARTSPDKPKHKGLTMFLVPLDSDGFEAQAVWTLSGERTNITFYSDVHIGDEWRIGDVDAGWQVLGLSLQDEHASGWGPHISRLLHHAEQWAASTPAEDGLPQLAKTDVRRRIARVAMEAEVSMLLQRRCVWMTEEGQIPVAEGPMSKVFSTEALARASQDVMNWWGPMRCGATSSRRHRSKAASNISCGSRWAPRSTPAPARCSAQSSPSAGSGYPVSFLGLRVAARRGAAFAGTAFALVAGGVSACLHHAHS